MNTAILFIDPFAPRAYDNLADMRGLGGTEATLLNIAHGLARDRPVAVAQARRTQPVTRGGVRFLPWPVPSAEFGTLVVINSWKLAVRLRRTQPHARIMVWLHVFPGRHNRHMGRALREAGVNIIAVSDSHARWLAAFMGDAAPRIDVMVNPIPDDLAPDATARDPDLLLFASAPHKGLDQVLARFGALQRHVPTLKLAIADPGYLRWPVSHDIAQGLIWLGTLPQDRLIAQYRRALCLFMPQTRFAETFGLVIVEANAVGCPALLHHDLGANAEVACPRSGLIDAADDAQILAQVMAWRQSPARCGARSPFRLSAVLAAWQRMLDGGSAFS